MPRPRQARRYQEPKEFEEKVVEINRVSKKTKGGNKVGFTALIVIGDRKGKVGVALGKANDVLSAIKKGVRKAKKKLVKVPLEGTTIPHEIVIKNGAARLILKPAPEGTGIIAGGSVRSVLELAGIKNVVAKILGTNNKLSNVTTTFLALKEIKSMVAVKEKLGQIPKEKIPKPIVPPKPVKPTKKKVSTPKPKKSKQSGDSSSFKSSKNKKKSEKAPKKPIKKKPAKK